MSEPIISFRDFSFQYSAQKSPTLKNINLDIYPGERILIAGPSGSGKSTLANCINGLVPHSYQGTCTGTVTVAGISVPDSGIFELSKHVGTVLQDPDGQFIGLTVGEDIAFALENDCIPQDEMKETVQKVADLVGAGTLLGHSPQALSGGQKQRVSLAGVMVDDVDILLFDEPLANLDPAAGKQTIELIEEIQSKEDVTVVIIEHRLEDVLWRSVDRIVIVDEGTIAADMKPDDLLCTDILLKTGIREPLYLAALKLAGVQITPEKRPAHISTVVLDNRDKTKVRSWYSATPARDLSNNNEILLEVKDLAFGYEKGTNTISGINFTVRRGEMLSIVGKNGAGKSTLAKLICGFEETNTGTIIYEGRDITHDPIRKRATDIGYVMQDPNHMISKTMIYDEVALGLLKSGLTEEEIRERVEETLKICGLYPFRNWPISALSFGQKKRVTIASILAMGPKLIILDEPTAGQDFKHYTDIMEFLSNLNRQGITVIMVTHDMHLMLEYTDRSLVFDTGCIIADMPAAEVLCRPDIIERASLKETSLFTLAERCGISPPEQFVQKFIDADREVRENA